MGSALASAVFKNRKETVLSTYTTLWDIPVVDIDGNKYEKLG
eukprot:CAMPEP_0116882492 /NCGR_PEP_ID=MMETSP0463-20121206/14740_1 /TAXON_ID=181622 /ORGANISM="Strombidinopsis sp, Strain SopsisLIS2011" /LENGTH=41 /DNA_ID= /DNA_START= /DNA_END= /DNA_ORIENTATION=